MRESEYGSRFLACLKDIGYWTLNLSPLKTQPGTPDAVVVGRGVVVFLEFKVLDHEDSYVTYYEFSSSKGQSSAMAEIAMKSNGKAVYVFFSNAGAAAYLYPHQVNKMIDDRLRLPLTWTRPVKHLAQELQYI